jgi:predicted thioesterase
MIEPGIKNTLTTKVTIDKTAKHYGSGLLDVFATPAMVALMEQCSHLSVCSMLQEGFDTVGTEVNIKHLRATPAGDKVTAYSELTETDGRKLVFSVKAEDSKGLIGEGIHIRYIINVEKFLSKLN